MSAVSPHIEAIHAWYRSNTPRDRSCVNPPASHKEIEATEIELGVSFPEELRELYSTYNGCPWISIGGYGCYLQSLSEVVESRELWREVQAEDPSYVWWDSTWIPVGFSGSRHYDCVDPRTGVVIKLWVSDEPAKVIAPSVSVWLSRYLEALERGEYVYDPVDEWVIAATALDDPETEQL